MHHGNDAVETQKQGLSGAIYVPPVKVPQMKESLTTVGQNETR